jgi:hypothetical protein
MTATKRGVVQEFYQTVVLQYEGDDCLIWPYSRGDSGYGQIRIKGKLRSVSRLVCEEANGPPPTPLHEGAHSCGNGHLACVSKRHLSWKSKVENEADKRVLDTHPRGERHVLAKLSEPQVREILSLRGVESQPSIATRFGVSPQLVCNIQKGRAWAWLQEVV